MPHKPGTGAIFGIVSENGVAKNASPVYLLDMRRDVAVGDAKTISKQLTRADGGFTFSGLDPAYTDYAVMASDEDGAEPKNALIQDRVQPVPVHAGVGVYGDWYTRILKDGADAGMVPWPVYGNLGLGLRPFGLRATVLLAGSGVDVTGVWGPQEVPSMASVRIPTTGRIVAVSGNNFADAPSDASVEFVLDLSSAGPTTTPFKIDFSLGSYSSGNSNNATNLSTGDESKSNGSGLFRATYNFSTKSLTFGIANSSFGTYTTIGTWSLSAYSGMTHLVLVYKKTYGASLYVNGSFVSLSASVLEPVNSPACAGGVLIGSTNSNGFGVDCVVGPVVSYRVALTGAQVSAHYNALFTGTNIPLVTGYARELSKELPWWYFRFGDSSFTDGVFSELHTNANLSSLPMSGGVLTFSDSSLVTGLGDSPLLGRSSFTKPKAVALTGPSGASGFPFYDRFSFTSWVYFNVETPAAEETIVAFNSAAQYNFQEGVRNPRPNGMLIVKRKVNKKLSVLFYNGTTWTETEFAYTPPFGEWVNLWVVVDKSGTVGSATLYAGTSTSAPVQVATAALPTGQLFTYTDYHAKTTIPWTTSPTVSIGADLDGRFVEMAALPGTVSLSRIQEIWAAKDIP